MALGIAKGKDSRKSGRQKHVLALQQEKSRQQPKFFGLGWACLQQFDNMSLNGLQRLCIFLVLTIPCLQLNWQASGNMTESNMTEIQNTINNYPIRAATMIDQIETIGKSISTHLNTLWAPAWNVVISKCPAGFNTVLYGYAFRNHWMWINGVAIPGDSYVVAYIIWKDYNCQSWQHIYQVINNLSTFSPAQVTGIEGYTFTTVNTDVWATAFGFMEHLNALPLLSGGAYTVVMSQYAAFDIGGYVCMVNTNYSYRINLKTAPNVGYGSYFMFQTR